MRQKFVISRNDVKNRLKISEYAIIDKMPKYAVVQIQQDERYTLLGEESYNSEVVASSISKGRGELLAMLRTKNMYPIGPYANKIVDSVIALYQSTKEQSTELFFDDVDLLPDLS